MITMTGWRDPFIPSDEDTPLEPSISRPRGESDKLAALGIEAHRTGSGAVPNIRLKLLKLGAQIRITVRKVWIRVHHLRGQ
jgi:hypothetical protein